MITIPRNPNPDKSDKKQQLLLLLRDMSMELIALDTESVDREMSKLN